MNARQIFILKFGLVVYAIGLAITIALHYFL